MKKKRRKKRKPGIGEEGIDWRVLISEIDPEHEQLVRMRMAQHGFCLFMVLQYDGALLCSEHSHRMEIAG